MLIVSASLKNYWTNYNYSKEIDFLLKMFTIHKEYKAHYNLIVMKKSMRLYITGSVQAIFFMAFVKEKAEELNVKGFIRNLEDGRVEIFIEGDANQVNEMIEICKKGHKNSNIKSVEIKPERFQDFKNFKILHI